MEKVFRFGRDVSSLYGWVGRQGRRVGLLIGFGVLCQIAVLSTDAFGQSIPSPDSIPASDPRVEMVGRFDTRDANFPRLGYPGTGLIFRFEGTSVQLGVESDSDQAALTVVVDHGAPVLQLLRKGTNDLVLAAGLEMTAHTVEIYKRTETWQGIVGIRGIRLPNGGKLVAPPSQPRRKLMFVGDSVTCGAGVNNNAQCEADPESPANDAYNAYGMVLGRRLDAQTDLVCYGGRGLVRDYRGLGESDGVLNAPQFFPLALAADDVKLRAKWDPLRWQPDAIVISLGTNDFNLQKTKPLDAKQWVAEYVMFLETVRKDYPQAWLLLTEGAIVTDPLLRQLVGETVVQSHDGKVKQVEAQHYPGNGCNAHPTRAQHVRIADDLEPILRQTLGW